MVLPILILVLIRSFGSNHFRIDAGRWAEPSVKQSNIILSQQIGSLPGEKLIINLDKENSRNNEFTGSSIHIPSDSVLNRNNLKTIRKHKGPVLLYSSETAVSARIWMILSQMGYKNIYILTDNADQESSQNR